MKSYEQTVKEYMRALDSSDLDKILANFASNAMVRSPFLGKMSAKEFFPKVLESSIDSDITVFDILTSAEGTQRAVGYFNYDWTLKDGNKVTFDCADVFEFDADGRIVEMIILYDTYPIREQVGDKFQ
jgi:ketosteroid isomerase-like protein